MIVISDTSPLNYLILIEEIDLLHKLFGSVIIPQAVFDELQNAGTPRAVTDWISQIPDWLEIKTASQIDQTVSLGAGEREAISLTEEINADLVLIDDRKARLLALERGLNVAGTINILESGAKRNLVILEDAFEKLQQTNFRIAPKLIEEILERNK